ncbi:GNAT family N-acetyltransferase [Exiguobacterium sp. TDN 0502]|uniref:GNAT family N-acetyltransferase n=1 Tax=Exiguobacterium sp. TDN 0502 TaxID=3420731 RepID=UPI003D780541
MIHIRRAPDVKMAYQTMQDGFQDYLIPLHLSEAEFQERILERDGNQLEHSFVAYHGDKPVGLWLNGWKEIDGQRVMRCGGLGISPQYRRMGIAKALYQAQLSYAKEIGMDLLMLEVIQGNDPAIRLYESLDYKISGEIGYFHITENRQEPTPPVIEEAEFLKQYDVQGEYIWQQDPHVMQRLQTNYYQIEESVVAVAESALLSIVGPAEQKAKHATEVVRHLPGTTYHYQSTNRVVWEALCSEGWTQRELKQYIMRQNL